MDGSLTIDATRQIVALLCRTSDRYDGGHGGRRRSGRAPRRARDRIARRTARAAGHARGPRRLTRLSARGRRPGRRRAGGRQGPDPVRGRLLRSASPRSPSLSAITRTPTSCGSTRTPTSTRPSHSASDYLGGMGLAGACGLWDSGFGAGVDPSRVVMFGVRDVDGPERVLLDTNGVSTVDRPGALADLLDGRKVYVHLDCDVIDPDVVPSSYPDAWWPGSRPVAPPARPGRRGGRRGRRGDHRCEPGFLGRAGRGPRPLALTPALLTKWAVALPTSNVTVGERGLVGAYARSADTHRHEERT